MKKNNYLISPNYLLQLENDELRGRIKTLISEFKELKKLYEEREREGMVQNKGTDAIIQESKTY
jgi:hypothetical protein